jgi:hypothetical protein
MATESRARRPSKSPVSETEKKPATLRLVTALLGLGQLERIGYINPSLSKEPAGVFIAKVSSSVNRISGQYLGPSDVIIT